MAKTLDVLREWFATHDILEQLITDNGPQFVADDFKVFAKSNGIKHVKSALPHMGSPNISFNHSSKASRHHMMMVVHCLSAIVSVPAFVSHHSTCYYWCPSLQTIFAT